jgi:hypothetical protein
MNRSFTKPRGLVVMADWQTAAAAVPDWLTRRVIDEVASALPLFARAFTRYAHNKDHEVLMTALDEFTHSSHPDHEARCIAIGFCRKGEFLVFNHWKFEKCLKLKRASVDNLIRALGYQSDRKIGTIAIVARLLPSLQGHPEVRNWSVRIRRTQSVQAQGADPRDVVAIDDAVWSGEHAHEGRTLHPWSIECLLNHPPEWVRLSEMMRLT